MRIQSPRAKVCLLHTAQQEVYYDQITNLANPQYNVGGYMTLSGQLDLPILKKAIGNLPIAYDVFRLKFAFQEAPPTCEFLPETVLEIEEIDFTAHQQPRETALAWMKTKFNQVYKLEKEDLVSYSILKIGEEEYWLYMRCHHLIMDGYGFPIISQFIVNQYIALVQDQAMPIIDYPTYENEIKKSQEYLASSSYQKDEDYWQERFRSIPELLLTKKNSTTNQLKTNKICLEIPTEQMQRFDALSEKTGTSLQQLTLVALIILFGKTRQQEEMTFGVPLHKRRNKRQRRVVGMFAGLLPFKGRYQPNQIVSDLIKEVKRQQRSDYRYQDYPLSHLNRSLQLLTKGRKQLFDITVVYDLLNLAFEFEGLQAKSYYLSSDSNNTPLEIRWCNHGNAQLFELRVTFQEAYFSLKEANVFTERLLSILEQLSIKLEQQVSDIDIVLPFEKEQLLNSFNATNFDYPVDKTIIDLLAEQAKNKPQNIAVSIGEETLTYQELHEKSNQLGHYLKSQEVPKETLIAICLQPSLEMIIGLLGILKSGAAYVPIDPDFPKERVDFLLQDTEAKIVVVNAQSNLLFSKKEGIDTIDLTNWSLYLAKQPIIDLPIIWSPSDLMYVIYTSGSTGKPKGVMIEHGSVVNELSYYTQVFNYQETDKQLLFANFVFDASVEQIFLPLVNGACLVLLEKERLLESDEIVSILNEKGITHIQATPTLLNTIPPVQYSQLKRVCAGGEVCPKELAENWSPFVSFFNKYGPTEATINTSYHLYQPDQNYTHSIPIGKPLGNTRFYVLNDQAELLPIGEIGELGIAGKGVARGYLNQKNLTQEQFITLPFERDSLVYKTGDLVRWLPDGNIEYIGRKDNQVKIRGYRIELGEIEAVLKRAPQVKQGVVIIKVDNGHTRLVAYFVPNQKEEGNKEAIMAFLKTHLPIYMVPSFLMNLNEFPTTASGKIDRKNLPNPIHTDLNLEKFTLPRNKIETILVTVWQELLPIENIGTYDNFFELGGDSIISIQMVSRMRKRGYLLQVKDIFEHQTIAALAEIIKKTKGNNIAQAQVSGAALLLPIQQAFFEKETTEVSWYNQSVLLEIEKSTSIEQLKQVVHALVQQHDALRFNYQKREEQWIQTYGKAEGKLVVENLSRENQQDFRKSLEERSLFYQSNLDIEKGNLANFVYFQTPEAVSKNRLLISIHHLAIDGVSWRILLNHFAIGLKALALNEKIDFGKKSHSYQFWGQTLKQRVAHKLIETQTNYWQSIIENQSILPVDKKVIAPTWKTANTTTLSLSTNLTQALLQQSQQAYQTEINDLLLAALAKTMTDWLGKQKVVIGLEGHGRETGDSDIDLSNTVGWFTNLYPIQLEVETEEVNGNLIKSVKEQLRSIPDKGMGYGLLRYLHPSEAINAKVAVKEWGLVFNYLGQLDNFIHPDLPFKLAKESVEKNNSDLFPFDRKLVLNCFVKEKQLVMSWTYNQEQYFGKTVVTLGEQFQVNLSQLIQHCQQVKKEYTPSDFGLAPEVNWRELTTFFDKNTLHNKIAYLHRLSPMQEGILFHELYNPQSTAYIAQLSLDFLNGLDIELFKLAWRTLIKEHTVLRSVFYSTTFPIPVQVVFKTADLPFSVLDYSDLSPEAQQNAIQQFLEEEHQKGFDLAELPLMRITLIKKTSTTYTFVWTRHHILMDGWSTATLMAQLLSIYETLSKGQKLVPNQIDHYRNYIQYIHSKDQWSAIDFWKNYLKEVENSTLLPFIDTASERNKGAGIPKEKELVLAPLVSQQINAFAKQHHITVNTLMQGVWAYLLAKYTQNSTILFGVTVSGRPTDLLGVEDKIGLFINTLPLRTTIEAETAIIPWLQILQKEQMSLREFQYSGLNEIQEWTSLKGDLFDSLLIFENYPMDTILKKGNPLEIGNLATKEQTNYLLNIIIFNQDKLSVTFSYDSSLLNEAEVERIKGHFETVLTEIVVKKKQKIGALQLLKPLEEKQLLIDFNNNELAFPEEATIVDLFEKQVQQTPQNIALIFEEEALTYEQFNQRVNQLTHHLKAKGVEQDDLVGLCLDRSLEMIISILSILKAGAAYIPIDPEYPAERISFLLEDAAPKLLIDRVFYQNFEKVVHQYSISNIGIKGSANDLYSVIYTSGSTGKPKGVLLVQKGLVNHIFNVKKYYNVTSNSRFLQFFNIGFDAAAEEIFTSLCFGATLCIRGKAELDPASLLKFIQRHQITHADFPTAFFENCINSLRPKDIQHQLITCGIGGEKVDRQFIRTKRSILKAFTKQLFNVYGPTETTLTVSIYDLLADKELGQQSNVPIGKPYPNRKLFILDEQLRTVPIGVAGELCIGGVGVSRGYLNRPKLTQEKFIPHPFSQEKTERLYRTGDLAKWLPDGNLVFLGRKDNQVKIRGYRVELGEVENTLMKYPSIAQAVVLVKQQQLVAYWVLEPTTTKTVDKADLFQFLQRNLPEYMVPKLLVELIKMPLTANGKTDKRALPEPDDTALVDRVYIAPKTETEKHLAIIWQNLLSLDKIGRADHFFEIGGHSLLATRLVAAIRKHLAIDVSIKEVFEHPTILTLGTHLDQLLSKVTNQKPIAPSLVPKDLVNRPTPIPLSFAQERLWFIDKLQGSIAYNVPALLRLDGVIDIPTLSASFQQILQRHEVLRTVYREEKGVAYQQIMDGDNWQLERVMEPVLPNKEELVTAVIAYTSTPFILSQDYMLKAKLVAVKNEAQYLMMVLHHIASDGWSIPILVKELVEIYHTKINQQSIELETLPIQYADYAIWQRNHYTEEILNEKLDFWQGQLSGNSLLELPTDFARPAIQSNKGESTSFYISKLLTQQIKVIAKQEEATLFMTLTGILKVLLFKYSGQTDISIGSPIANRTQAIEESLIGFFVNTLVFRNQFSPTVTFKQLLTQIKQTALTAYQHQDVPFEKIVNKLTGERDRSRSPLFQVMLVLQNNVAIPAMQLGDAHLSLEPIPKTTAKFDLTFLVVEKGDGLNITIEYATDLFQESTILRLQHHFQNLVQAIIQNPDQSISQLSMVGMKEQQQLVDDFNTTHRTYDQISTVIELWEQQVNQTPNHPALVFENQILTYQEVNQKANQLARFLQKRGIKEQQLVAICMDRSIQFIIGVLGILKIGAAYVPIDPSYPKERLLFIIEDIGAKLMLGQSLELADNDLNVEVIDLEKDWNLIAKEAISRIELNITLKDLVYLIYTSGSTGKPKGVMIENRSLFNYLSYAMASYGQDLAVFNCPLFTSPAFDLTQTSIFLPLLTGGTLTIYRTQPIENVLNSIIGNPQFNVLKITPAHTLLLPSKKAENLKKIIIGGEQLEKHHLKKVWDVNAQIQVYNEYGPTEATIGSTVLELKRGDSNITIGKPIDNTQIYLVNEQKAIVPIGITGEICIGGMGLSRGYWNRPTLTQEKFTTLTLGQNKIERIYRTGDLAKWLPNGDLVYLGRKDNQVKINGYRIELGEIEQTLNQSSLVQQGVVLAEQTVNGRKQLITYLVPNENYTQEKIRLYLKQELPLYMLPALIREIAEFPLTTNGKIDRKALQLLQWTASEQQEYIAPTTEIEIALTDIWKILLNLERIGLHDNFFELGGDSIITIQVVSRARQLGYQLQASQLFEYQTIAALATIVKKTTKPIANQERLTGFVDLLPIQQWFLEHDLEETGFYNQAILLEIDKRVDANKLEKAIAEIVNQHDALRLVFQQRKGRWEQTYSEKKGHLEILDFATTTNNELEQTITENCQQIQQQIQLSKGNLFQFVWMKMPVQESKNRLFLVAHHLLIDGVSWRIFLEDLALALDALLVEKEIDLGLKTSSYRDWAMALKAYASQKELLAELPFWKNIQVDSPILPTDKKEQTSTWGDTAAFTIQLDASLTKSLLQEVNQVYHTEINDILLTAFAQTISLWATNSKVVIGLEGHGRVEKIIDADLDLSNTIGWLTNLYPISIEVSKGIASGALIKSVKEQLRSLPAKGMGYGLLKYLHQDAALRSTLKEQSFDIIFNYLGQLDNVIPSDSLFQPAEESIGDSISPTFPFAHKLVVNSAIKAGQLAITWTYSQQTYEEATIAQLATDYTKQLTILINHCCEKEGQEWTPSDYSMQGKISNDELTELLGVSEDTEGEELMKF